MICRKKVVILQPKLLFLMKRSVFSYVAISAMGLLMASCGQKAATNEAEEQVETHVLHAQDVEPLSPDSVISLLKSGNAAFMEHHEHHRDAVAQLKESAHDGQHPLAIVLSCIDARVPVEIIFDKGVGDLFVTRIAGNVVSPDVLGSMEYACEHSGSKVVVVMGHTNCGAVHSACEGVKAGNMTQMLAKIQPAISECAGENEEGAELEKAVVYANVRNMIKAVREGSSILTELEEEGKVKVVGAVFDLETGRVEFLDE